MKLVPMPSPPKGAAPFRQWMRSVLLGRDGHALLECEIEQSLAWHFDLISFGDDFRACAKSTTDLAPMPVPLPPPAIAFASRASFASSCHFNPVSGTISDLHFALGGPGDAPRCGQRGRRRYDSGLVANSCKETCNRNLQVEEHSFPPQREARFSAMLTFCLAQRAGAYVSP